MSIKRIYYIALNVPAGTGTPKEPYGTNGNQNFPPLKLPKGNIKKIYPVFPSGASELLFAQLVDANNNIIYPTGSNQGGFINLTSTANLAVEVDWSVTQTDNFVNVNAYNLDTTNAHEVIFGIEMELI